MQSANDSQVIRITIWMAIAGVAASLIFGFCGDAIMGSIP